MSERDTLSTEELLERIHELQEEIFEREDRISDLLDSARPQGPIEEIEEAKEEGDNQRRLRHLKRLMTDWDTLVARSRAVTDDDMELVAALVTFVGNLLVIQPDGISERWIERLEEFLKDQRAKVS